MCACRKWIPALADLQCGTQDESTVSMGIRNMQVCVHVLVCRYVCTRLMY
jgi:hypothetical protein